MPASVSNLQLFTFFNITETTGGAPSGISAPSLFQEMNQNLNLGSGSTPSPSHFAIYRQSLGTTLSPSFAAAQGTNGNVDASGKKLLAIYAVSPSGATADVNIVTGAANGYVIPQPIKVRPGGFALQWFGTALTLVDATHKTVDITGDGTTTPEIGFLFGL